MFTHSKPYVVVVDGSYSVNHKKITLFRRKDARFPDAYQGYRNFFIALNEGMNSQMAREMFEEFQKDPEFIDELYSNPKYVALVAKVLNMGTTSSDGSSYKMRFWTPAFRSQQGKLKFSEKLAIRQDRAPPIFNFDEDMGSPTLIMVQSTIESPKHPLSDKSNPTIPSDIQKWIRGEQKGVDGENKPAYFDDKDHFKSFNYAYIPNYGIQRSPIYAQTAQKYINDLVDQFGEERFTSPATLIKDERRIDGYVFDLTGTLARFNDEIPDFVKAKINQLLSIGKKVAIVTDDKATDNIEGRLINQLDRTLLQNLSIYLNGGRTLWTFDRFGYRISNEEDDKVMTPLQKKLFEETIRSVLEIEDISPRHFSFGHQPIMSA